MSEDVAKLLAEAEEAILKQIIANAEAAQVVLPLAEALAWIRYPNNPHGGGVKVS